jgi:hypothetical protein
MRVTSAPLKKDAAWRKGFVAELTKPFGGWIQLTDVASAQTFEACELVVCTKSL